MDRGVKRAREENGDPFEAFKGQPAYDKLQSLLSEGLITADDFDDRALDGLSSKDPGDAVRILDSFQEANPRTMRNKAAYLCSLMRKPASTLGPAGVCSRAKELLLQLEKSKRMPEHALDEQCIIKLARLPERKQVEAVREFSDKDLTETRNFSAQFISVIRRVDERHGYDGGRFDDHGRHGGTRGFDGRQGGFPPGGPPPPGLRGGPPMGGPPMGVPAFNSDQLSSLAGALGMGAVGAQPMPPPGRSIPAAPAAPEASVQRGVAPKKHYGLEQMEWGVRIDEFHGLSSFAAYVHPAVARKLQNMWDSGNRLLSLLDDTSWEAMSKLYSSAGVAALRATEEALKYVPQEISAVNTIFMGEANKYLMGGAAAAPMGRMQPAAGLAPAPAPAAPVPYVDPSAAAVGGYGGGAYGAPPAASAGPAGATGYGPQYGPSSSGSGAYAPQVGGGAVPSGGRRGLAILTPNLQRVLQSALATSRKGLKMEYFDDGVLEGLSTLPPSDAEGVIAEASAADFQTIRNPGGWLIGVIKRRRNLPGSRHR